MTSRPHPILRIRSPIVGRGEQVYEISGPLVTIGRGEDCDVVLLEQAASRLHAEIRATEAGYVLFDAGSHNGVWLDGHRVTRHHLQDGTSFRIGETTMQLVLHPHAQPTFVEEGSTEPSATLRRALAPTPAPPPASAPIASPELAQQLRESPPALTAPAPAPPTAASPSPAPAPPLASAPSFVDFGPPEGTRGRAPSSPYIMGDSPRDAGSSSFVWSPPQRPGSSSSPSFYGELADVSEDESPFDRRRPSRARVWLGLLVVLVVVALAAVAVTMGWNLDDLRGLVT